MNLPELDTIAIESKGRFLRKNVTSITLNNYGIKEAFFINKGIKRALPPAKTISGVLMAYPFSIENAGNPFDVDLTIDFPEKTGRVIIDFFQNTNC